MTRVLTGEALVGEDGRLAERVEQMLERVEASLRQSLRLARADAGAGADGGSTTTTPLPGDYDPTMRASLIVSYVLGRWHRYAKSGFGKSPTEYADAQLRLILQ